MWLSAGTYVERTPIATMAGPPSGAAAPDSSDVTTTHHGPDKDGVIAPGGTPLEPRKACQTRYTAHGGPFWAGDDTNRLALYHLVVRLLWLLARCQAATPARLARS